jgi:FkbM family methyltransferase
MLADKHLCPVAHVEYLEAMKRAGVEPRVIYDIGSCVCHWARHARRLWPDARVILFDALTPAEFLYKQEGYEYHLGVLSDRDGRPVTFYESVESPGGNSYYREDSHVSDVYYPPSSGRPMVARTLDSVIEERGFPLPDLIKIDVQGSEVDIINGGMRAVNHARDLIVELQHEQYNVGAPKVDVSKPYIESLGFECVASMFSNNGPDADYHFRKRDRN